MSERNSATRRNVTGDPNTIRTWGEERGAVPIYYADEDRYELVHRDEVTDEHETHTWDKFSSRFGDRDEVLVYNDDESGDSRLGSAELVDREDAITRATLDEKEVQEALLDGETVTTELEEEVVVERRVKEKETIESELVATEEVDRRVVDRDLVDRRIVDVEVGHIDVRSELVDDDVVDHDRETTGDRDTADTTKTHEVDRDHDGDDHSVDEDSIDVEIEETWRVTEEVLERMTIESRVIDDTITEDESVEVDNVESSVDVEGIHRNLIDQGLVSVDSDTDDFVGDDTIRSEVLDDEEGTVVRSQLFQRTLIDSDVVERKTLRYDLVETTKRSEETTTTTERDAEIVDITLDDERYADYEYDFSDETIGRGRTDATSETTETAETTGTTASVSVDPSDQGKSVLDHNGNEIGIVDDVDEEGNRLYVDPDPSMFDKVKAQLGWGGQNDDDYVITPDQIADRSGNQIVVREA